MEHTRLPTNNSQWHSDVGLGNEISVISWNLYYTLIHTRPSYDLFISSLRSDITSTRYFKTVLGQRVWKQKSSCLTMVTRFLHTL